MGLGHFGGAHIMHYCTTDATNFVGGKRHADSSAAKQNAEIVAAFLKFLAGGYRRIGVVHRILAVNAHILNQTTLGQ